MSEASLKFTSHIAGPPEVIFDLVADLPGYGRWLPDSSAFGGTVDVTPYPVRLGTTYLETGPIQKPGKVIEFDRPRHIGFQHTVMIRSPIETDVEARIRYSFEPGQGGTAVLRELDLVIDLRGPLKLLRPALLWGFREENVRTLACLKRYVENRAPASRGSA
ncbi:MAG TPA: SRPBCC family protein [Myxococcaceae bacterium]|nr:SRPBCC family protein [Myxococcaceae bacterium]